MSLWLDTRGYTSLAIAICDRCKMKRSIMEMVADPNAPGTYVCERGCVDEYDPWRLPAREPEDISLEHPRPDLPLVFANSLSWTFDSTIVKFDSTKYTFDRWQSA